MKCRYRIKKGGCKLGVCSDSEVCEIETAEPNCPDYQEPIEQGIVKVEEI